MIPRFQAGKWGLPGRPASFLARPRLEALWEERSRTRLLLVTAGAGFGKSSLLADRTLASRRPCVWFGLSELDADPERLADRLLEPLDAKARDMAGGPQRSTERTLAVWITALREEGRGRMIVLDDSHGLAGSPEALRFIERMVRFLPASCTLVIASREHLDLPVMRLQSQGELARIETADLAFDEDEVKALFALRLPDASPSDAALRRLSALTEGWAAGLEIFFQRLSVRPEQRLEEALESFRQADVGWFPYFAEEVLAGLEPRMQRFLMESSLLPSLEAGLCDEVLDRKDSEEVLGRLVRGNLFTFACGDQEGAYRYHQLFRDALRERLLAQTGVRELRALHRAAGDAFRRRGMPVEALASLIEAGEADGALRLVDKWGERLLETGRFDAIRRALEALPAAHLSSHVGAQLILGRLLDLQGDWDGALRRYRRALKLCEGGARRVELMSLVAQVKMRQGQYRSCLRLCDQALAEPGPISQSARGRILGLRGVSACDLGRYAEGERYLLQAESLFRRSKDETGEGRVLYLLAANVHIYQGDFRKARSAARRALAIFRRLREPRRICHSLGVLGWVMYATGELREARRTSEAALRQAEVLPYPIMQGVCHYTLGRCDLLEGDLEGAGRHLEAARLKGRELGEAELLAVPYLGLADLALAEGNRHRARRLAEHALSVVLAMKERQLEAQCERVLGLCYEGTRRAVAAEHWGRAEKLCRSLGTRFELHRIQLLRLDALDLDDRAARPVLEKLLEGVAEMEHEALLEVFERPRAGRVLARALRLGVEPDFAAGMLSRLGETALPQLLELSEAGDEKLRLRAVELLSQIGGGPAHAALRRVARGVEGGSAAQLAAEELEQAPRAPLRIRALGSLVVTVEGREITHGQWTSKRALRLFQLLIARGFRWVPQEQILEALWPDSEPDKARNNLRQSTFLLRKILEPGLDEARRSRYVRHQNEACRLEPGEGFDYDVAAFTALLDRAEEHWGTERRAEALAYLERALELYRGDFLSESPYEETVVEAREALRDRCLRAVKRLLEGYSAEGRLDRVPALCRRGLAADPYDEEFHKHRVAAQHGLGNRREALEEYHRYEEMMIRELDLPPSLPMQALAEKAASLGGG